MQENYEKEINEIIDGMKCSRDFACYKSELNPCCKVKDVELENHLEIEGEYDSSCKYLVVSNGVPYCRCPLCVYLTKQLGHWDFFTGTKRFAIQKIFSSKQDTN